MLKATFHYINPFFLHHLQGQTLSWCEMISSEVNKLISKQRAADPALLFQGRITEVVYDINIIHRLPFNLLIILPLKLLLS